VSKLGYQPALDGLRAVAITAVVGVHAFGFPANGGLGVDLFFVLSGFLITTLLLEERARTGGVSVVGFYRRRALRLLPALFAFLAVYLALALTFFTTARESAWVHVGGVLSGIFYVTNVLKASGFDTPNGVEHLWSLSAEEQFYLVWPAALLLVVGVFRRRLWPAAVVLAAGVVTVHAIVLFLLVSDASLSRITFGPDTRAGSIIIGCLLAVVIFGRSQSMIGSKLGLIALGTVGALLLVDLGVATFSLPLLVFGLACACLIAVALDPTTRIARALAIAPAVYLGKISYSLYLWHLPILVWLGADNGGLEPVDLAAVALAVAAASASYHLVERPFLRLKQSRRRAPEARPSTETAPALA
jgi:peptidoglycan/LPS O-acetylase OafA/YrhL